MLISKGSNIYKTLERLESHGFEGYLVGGWVRDAIMGKTPHDCDIATDALPEQTISCFKGYRTVKSGIKHGTVGVVIGGEVIEITSYRFDGEYSDNRHPQSVSFTKSLAEDLARRDFTINAMAYNPKTGIVDLFGGRRHIEQRLIVCVGEADKRFNEDALRILRAMRFSSVLDFSIEERTAEAIHLYKGLLAKISRERIYAELCSLICGRAAGRVFNEFFDVFCEFLPELDEAFGSGSGKGAAEGKSDALLRFSETVGDLPADKNMRLALLFCGLEDGAKAATALRKLKADGATVKAVSALIANRRRLEGADKPEVKRLIALLSLEGTRALIRFERAAGGGQIEEELERVGRLVDLIEAENSCVCAESLDINGGELLALGAKPGKSVGGILKRLLDEVIEEKTVNEKGALIKRAREIIAVQDEPSEG